MTVGTVHSKCARERKRRKMVYKGEMKDEQTYRRRDGDQK